MSGAGSGALPAELVGRYELGELLGKGASGAVYRIVERATGRALALKLLKKLDDPARRERFAREGQITASLDHPAVLSVHAAGLHLGRGWLVCDLVEGARPFVEACREVPLRLKVERLRDAARGLGVAHARGVVHRDVKPDNVLVDAAGRVRVADFGLAVAHDMEQVTKSGALVGTPLYMAPEQFAADRARVGPATDVWALGAVLYEALSGVPPFSAEAGFVQLAMRVTDQPVVPLRRRRGELPAELEAVCGKALEKAPEDRYSDADDLADDLDRYLAGDDVLAGSGALPRLNRRRRRRLLLSAPLVLAGALSVAAALGWVAPVGGDREAEPQEPRRPPPRSAHAPVTWELGEDARFQVELLRVERRGELTVAERRLVTNLLGSESTPGRVALRGVIKRVVLQARLEEGGRSLRYDSEGGRADHPLAPAVNASLRLFFDRRTGGTERTEGLDELRDGKVLPAARSEGWGAESGRWRALQQLFSDRSLDDDLDLLVGPLPPQGGGRTEAWSMSGSLHGAGFPGRVPLALSWAPRGEGRLTVEGRAKELLPEMIACSLRGGATFSEGRLAECRLQVRYEMAATGVHELELSYRYLGEVEEQDEDAQFEADLLHAEATGVMDRMWLRELRGRNNHFMSMTGDFYLDGGKVPRDAERAVRWFRRSAEGGQPEAMSRVGQLLLGREPGVEADTEEAFLWLERAVAAGQAGAMGHLGVCLVAGVGGRQDRKRGLGLLNDSLEQGTGLGATRDLARCLTAADGEEAARTARLLRSKLQLEGLSATRRANARFLLGKLLLLGWGVPADPPAGMALLEKAARGGSLWAVLGLVEACERGIGVPRDPGEAARHRRAAARFCKEHAVRDGEITLHYARMLWEGYCVGRDAEEAQRWVERYSLGGPRSQVIGGAIAEAMGSGRNPSWPGWVVLRPLSKPPPR